MVIGTWMIPMDVTAIIILVSIDSVGPIRVVFVLVLVPSSSPRVFLKRGHLGIG